MEEEDVTGKIAKLFTRQEKPEVPAQPLQTVPPAPAEETPQENQQTGRPAPRRRARVGIGQQTAQESAPVQETQKEAKQQENETMEKTAELQSEAVVSPAPVTLAARVQEPVPAMVQETTAPHAGKRESVRGFSDIIDAITEIYKENEELRARLEKLEAFRNSILNQINSI